jgi:hypothetical protein
MDLPILYFFCDETSHRGHRFAGVSGIALREERIKTLNYELTMLKLNRGKAATSELKWSKVNKHDMPLYEDVCRYFFSLVKAKHIHFHALICDFQEYDHRALNLGFRETSISKSYYQILLHRCCKLCGDRAYTHVRPDTGDCTRALPKFLPGLNADAIRRFQLRSKPIRSINKVESQQSPIIQMNDIILGAILAHRNGRHLEVNASPHKAHLAQHILALSGLRSYAFSTPYDQPHFTIWNWRGTLKGRL